MFVIACQDELEVSVGNPSEFLLLENNTEGISINYTVTTAQYMRPSNLQDTSLMTLSERSLMVPEIWKSNVIFELDKNGNFAGEIDFLPVESQLPANVIGRHVAPEGLELGKIEFNNEISTFYNLEGEVKNIDALCIKVRDYYVQLSSNLVEKVIISEEAFETMMLAWEDAGYEVTDYGGNYQSIRIDLPNGNYSYVFVDKSIQAVVGNANFNKDGSLESRTVSFIETDEEGEYENIKNIFATPFTGSFSEVDMEIVVSSELSNISINSNL
ncbi:MAG: hypothetical protein EA409_13530 [Saprospirales bacterium]|nr:MAG: hypothetical protein EA409_13530 [Saprospirales bacterium]